MSADNTMAQDGDTPIFAALLTPHRSLGRTDGTQPGAYSTVPVRLATPTGVTAIAGGLDAGFALVP